MKAAIYSRKSRFTGKGESVENQIFICKDYAVNFLAVSPENIRVYEDEGFSGGNTDRPQFQQMLQDAKSRLFDIIICYRLDRVSRNVSDFSRLIDELQKYNVSFISVKEQFDTSKPMGRAMMYIASVFSQLERETIAERIRDNMLQLSKTGRWLGGTTPTGYKSELVLTRDEQGKEYTLYKLVVIPEEAETIKRIYDKYMVCKSIAGVEQFLNQNGITTKNGLAFGRFSIRFILSNPVYAMADDHLYEYLLSNGYEVYSDKEEFNGSSGLMSYNKTKQACSSYSDRYRNRNQWVIAVGLHSGIIPSGIWIGAQELLLRNKTKSVRKVRSSDALLAGILRCAACGSYMRPKLLKRNTPEGQQVFYYICEQKEKSKKAGCQTANLNGNVIDNQVMKEIKHVIKRLLPHLNEVGTMMASREDALDESETEDLVKVFSDISGDAWSLMSINSKRKLLQTMIKKAFWDGKKLELYFTDPERVFPQ